MEVAVVPQGRHLHTGDLKMHYHAQCAWMHHPSSHLAPPLHELDSHQLIVKPVAHELSNPKIASTKVLDLQQRALSGCLNASASCDTCRANWCVAALTNSKRFATSMFGGYELYLSVRL